MLRRHRLFDEQGDVWNCQVTDGRWSMWQSDLRQARTLVLVVAVSAIIQNSVGKATSDDPEVHEARFFKSVNVFNPPPDIKFHIASIVKIKHRKSPRCLQSNRHVQFYTRGDVGIVSNEGFSWKMGCRRRLHSGIDPMSHSIDGSFTNIFD
jgi:hypothetical protein